MTIAGAGMWYRLPKALPLGSEPLEVELGVEEVLGDESNWPRSRALPALGLGSVPISIPLDTGSHPLPILS